MEHSAIYYLLKLIQQLRACLSALLIFYYWFHIFAQAVNWIGKNNAVDIYFTKYIFI